MSYVTFGDSPFPKPYHPQIMAYLKKKYDAIVVQEDGEDTGVNYLVKFFVLTKDFEVFCLFDELSPFNEAFYGEGGWGPKNTRNEFVEIYRFENPEYFKKTINRLTDYPLQNPDSEKKDFLNFVLKQKKVTLTEKEREEVTKILENL